MYLSILDLILLLGIFLFISFGFWAGFISMVGSLVGLVIGTWVAGHYFAAFGAWLSPYVLDNTNLANIIAFFVMFTLVNRLIGILVWFANKVFKLFTIIPFTKSINRVLGALLGFLESTLFLGMILYMVSRFNFSDFIAEQLINSQIAVWLIEMAGVLTPLLPDIVRQVTPIL